ncbi:hypothetical protein [Niabella aurantiaca]|uniref:hypothetical protein n=1 Tax=Niabella aurantiaca TaxID=379900 RepID=UPI00035DAD25|nr:hypothetical protein [Niabella aurantiaca]
MPKHLKKILQLFCCCCLLLTEGTALAQEAGETALQETSGVYTEELVTDATSTEFIPVEDFENERTSARTVPDSFINRLQKDAAFGYVKTGLKQPKTKSSQTSPRGTPAFFTVLPYIAIFVLLLVWYLTANNFILFRKKSTTLAVAAIQEDHQDIFSIDYATSIRMALQQKDYRLAIRLQYLELLKKLSDRELIHFLPDKTNFEYLTQMRSSGYYDDFFTATRNYEYSWYGLFDISEIMYQKINNTFQHLKQKL